MTKAFVKREYIKRFYLKPEEKERLHQIKFFLEQNFSKRYTIPELSKMALMNEFKLKKGFKHLFKHSIHDFHLHIRLGEAKRYLLETNLSLDEIAEKTGYGYSSSLIAAFKLKYKITPGSFRIENMQDQ